MAVDIKSLVGRSVLGGGYHVLGWKASTWRWILCPRLEGQYLAVAIMSLVGRRVHGGGYYVLGRICTRNRSAVKI